MSGASEHSTATARRRDLEAAGEWLLRLQADDLDPQQLALWLEWYADPTHRAAFDEMQARYEALRRAPKEQRHALAAKISAMSDSVRPFRTPLSRPTDGKSGRSASQWSASRVRIAAVAAGFLVLLLVGGMGLRQSQLWFSRPAVQTAAYHTQRAQHERVRLPDDSMVRLGALSSMSLSFTADVRYLVLEHGEALFDVAHDSSRPFIVQAGTVTVKAVGTTFNVRRIQERVVITVSEGAVDVARDETARTAHQNVAANPVRSRDDETARAIRVAAGEQISIDAQQPSVSVVSADVAAAVAWQSGRLEFINEPMSAVIATVNRYSSREIIVGEGVADISYTGTVMQGRTDEWLLALQDVFPVRIRAIGSDAVVISASAAED